MKKCLVVTNHSGGLYVYRRDLLFALAQEYKLYASTPNNGYFKELSNIPCDLFETEINRRGMNPVQDFKLLLQYFKIIRKVNPDLVITYTIKPNIYAGMVCRLLHVSYAVNITGLGTSFQKKGVLKSIIVKLYRAAMKTSKIVFFENSANRDVFLNEKIITENRTCVLNGAGVNLNYFSIQDFPTSNNIHFLFMGRIMKEKGVNELFGSMRRLRSEGFACVLDVLGTFEDDYETIIKGYEKEGWLLFHPFTNDVRPYIKSAHCSVLPSWHEGMSNTNLECAASARPIITTDIPGCREAVQDGISGILCEVKNETSLYRAMKHFLSMKREEQKAMGLAGRKYMEEKFDKNEVVKNTIRELLK